MVVPNILHQAHYYVQMALPAGGIAIDATVGNGNDTLFLAKKVGKSGWVYGFDIQEQAIVNTRQRLEQANEAEQVMLFQYPHQEPWTEILPLQHKQQVDVVMFNLGYLPNGDPSIITKPDNTIRACKQAFQWLKPNGIITLVLYSGHVGGAEEVEELIRWCQRIPSDQALIIQHQLINRTNAPSLVVIGNKGK